MLGQVLATKVKDLVGVSGSRVTLGLTLVVVIIWNTSPCLDDLPVSFSLTL